MTSRFKVSLIIFIPTIIETVRIFGVFSPCKFFKVSTVGSKTAPTADQEKELTPAEEFMIEDLDASENLINETDSLGTPSGTIDGIMNGPIHEKMQNQNSRIGKYNFLV